MKHPSIHFTTERTMKQALKKISFRERKIRKLSHKIDILYVEALSLIGDNDAYYKNRMKSWALVSKIQKLKGVC